MRLWTWTSSRNPISPRNDRDKDLVSLGFDGFVVNSGVDLATVAQRVGKRGFVAGNVNTRILTLGAPSDVVQEVKRCLEDARPAGGHFIHAGGDLPHNIPLDNIRAYFDAAAELGATWRT